MIRDMRNPALNVAGWLAYSFRWSFIIYWIIYVLMFAGILAATSIFDFSGDNAISMWEGFGISPKIFLLVIGILLTPFTIGGFVSNGVTRKRFCQGVIVMMGIASAIFALIITIGYPIETFIFEQKGWTAPLDSNHLFDARNQYGLIFLEHLLLFFTYFGSGWMFGTFFYRFDWKIAVPLMAPGMAPFVVLEAALSLSGIQDKLGLTGGMTRLVAILLCIVAAAAVFGSTYAMLRKVTIKKKAFA